jgi:hypothetical protein
MTFALLFWILMLLWVLFGGWTRWGNAPGQYVHGDWLLLLVLIGLLGWRVFGAPVHG